MLDFTVNHAQKTQGYIELNHERVDHHQVTQGHVPIDHALCGSPQHGDQGHGNDDLLTHIQSTQRVLCFDACAAQFVEFFVIPFGFKRLIAKVLDGFIVQQRINGSRVGAGIKLIDLLAKLGAPLRHCHSEINIQTQRAQSDDGIPFVVLNAQYAQHQHHFNQGWHDAVKRISDEGLNTLDASFNVTAHAASLALQMKTQTQFVQMREGLQSNGASRTLGGFGEDQLAQLGECGNRQPQHSIAQ